MTINNIYWLCNVSTGPDPADTTYHRGYLNGYDGRAIITDIGIHLETPINVDPIPLKGSATALGVTYVGTVKEIKIEGKFVGSDAYLKNTIDYFEGNVTDVVPGLMNGIQEDTSNVMGYHFRLGFKDTVYRVAISDFRWTWEEANPSSVSYYLTLKQIA